MASNKEILDRLEKLEKAVFKEKREIKPVDNAEDILKDIKLTNIRAFVKRYASGKSGSRKFVLLIAFLSEGNVGVPVEMSEIIKHWQKMQAKPLLGGFNRYFANEAKTQGWVNSEKYGTYSLASSWKESL